MTGWIIERANGAFIGPFHTRTEAEDFMHEGDNILAVNEHGNVIDYGPQFDEDDSTPAWGHPVWDGRGVVRYPSVTAEP